MIEKVLITGSGGFIGRNLKEMLSRDYEIFSPSHQQLELTSEEEVTNYLRENNFDTIVHCAAKGVTREMRNDSLAFEQNLRMFFNLTKNEKYYKKLINLGSGAEYNKENPLRKVSEKDFGLSVPKDLYGFYKYICSNYIENTKNNITNLRVFGVFGKYEDLSRFISESLCKYILNQPIEINQNVIFDYLYINDLTKIIKLFIENKVKYKSYNIGTGKSIDLITIADKIKKIGNKEMNILVKKRGINKEYTCDVSRLQSEFKGIEYTNIDNAIKELYQWYKKDE